MLKCVTTPGVWQIREKVYKRALRRPSTMTTKKPDQTEETHILENIAETVHSIDRTVDEILDRLSDHFDEREWYSKSWYGNGYHLKPENDNDSD